MLLSTYSLHTDTLITANLLRIPEAEVGFFEFMHLFNIHYGKYYIPLIFILINSVIVWQNRKRFCHHFVRRYPRFLAMYILTFFLELAFLFNPFIPYPADRFANLSFIIFSQIPLLGYSLYVIFLRKGYTLGLGSAIMILCILWTLGFFTCFSSPYTSGISEGVSQNEVQGFHWLSEVKENYPNVMSSAGENKISALPESLSGSVGMPSDFIETTNRSPNYISKNDLEAISSLERTAEFEPSYLVVTTFSKALSLNEQENNVTLVSPSNSYNSHDARKIYDSLNIEIYEYKL
jgi:hypothetical protein